MLSGYKRDLVKKVYAEKKCKFCRKYETQYVQYVASKTTRRAGRWGRLDKVFCYCDNCGHESEHRIWTPILSIDMFKDFDLSRDGKND